MVKRLIPEQLGDAPILVRAPNWVGDAVMCLPALRALRKALPRAEMVLLARPWVRDVIPTEELGCGVISYDTQGQHRGWRGRMVMASSLRQRDFSAAILFQNAFDAALVTWLARIPIRAGYSRQGRGPLLTHAVAVPRRGEIPRHEAHYYLEMLRRLGLIPGYDEVREILLPTSEAVRRAARGDLEEQFEREAAPLTNGERPVVGISPGASFGTAKRWPAARFAELTSRLTKELGARCVFFGAPQEKPLADEVQSQAGVVALSLAGKTSLGEFIRLVQACDLYVTNDIGTMHVAAGLGVPTLAIFGPTNEHETRPLGPRVELRAGEAFCRPCKLRHCPIDHRCMKSVTVETVFQAARVMLWRGKSPALEESVASEGRQSR